MPNLSLESVFDKLPRDKKLEFLRNLSKQLFTLKDHVEKVYKDDPDYPLYMDCFYDD